MNPLKNIAAPPTALFHLATVVAVAFSLYLSLLQYVCDLEWLLFHVAYWIILFAAWALRTLVFTYNALTHRPDSKRATGWPRLLIFPALLATALILVETSVTLRVAFHLSRPELQQFAERTINTTPETDLSTSVPRLGPLQVEAVTQHEGTLYFQLAHSSLFAYNQSGLAYSPTANPPQFRLPQKTGFKIWPVRYFPIAPHWYAWRDMTSHRLAERSKNHRPSTRPSRPRGSREAVR